MTKMLQGGKFRKFWNGVLILNEDNIGCTIYIYTFYICVCVCCRTPDRPVFPNNEVVEFQPRTVTSPDLGSVAKAYTIFLSPRPICSNRVLNHLFPSPWDYLLFPPPIFHPSTPLLSLFAPASPPPYCPVAEQPSTCKTLPPVSRHRSSALTSPASRPKGVPHASLYNCRRDRKSVYSCRSALQL